MSHLKNRIINDIISREGGYVNDPSDSGGETKYGITEAVARKSGYHGPMQNLPIEMARDIYEEQYWKGLNLDYIHSISPVLAEELADTGVNMGVSRAGKFLQHSLNLLNDAGLYVDGDIGPRTIKALTLYVDKRKADGIKVLFRALNGLQCTYYMELAERRPKDKKFLYGWILHRVK